MFWRLTRLESARQPLALIALIMLSSIGTSILIALSLSGQYFGDLARELIHGSADEQVLVVAPKQPSDEQQAINFERRTLSEQQLHDLSQLPGLLSQDVLHAVPIPATISLTLPPVLNTSQFVGVFALDGAMVPEELHERWMQIDGPLPILLNDKVISLFNITLAERYNLPQISPELLLGASVDLILGSDRFRSLNNSTKQKAKFIGYHQLVPLWGIAIPQHRADALLHQVTDGNIPAGAGPIQAHLRFGSQADVINAQALIDQWNLRLTGASKLTQVVAAAEGIIDQAVMWAAIILTMLVLIATLALLLGVVNERRATITLYRQQGARWWQLVPIFSLGPALAVGLGSLAAMIIVTSILPPQLNELAQQFFTNFLEDGELTLPESANAPVQLNPKWWWFPASMMFLIGLCVAPVMASACRLSLWLSIKRDHS